MVRKKETVRETEEGVLLNLKVTTNADKFVIEGVNEWTGRLHIRVTSRAQKGKANKELIEKLEERLGKNLRIKAGHRSRKKLIFMRNTTEEEVKEKLGIP